MNGRCGWCGDVSERKVEVPFDSSLRCYDIKECMRRGREQLAASEWYEEEVKRMIERAPA